jgi:hypothetical protein
MSKRVYGKNQKGLPVEYVIQESWVVRKTIPLDSTTPPMICPSEEEAILMASLELSDVEVHDLDE